jgi:uncharacterized membrane protein
MSSPPRLERFDRVDALRGAAIVWMALFHFGFDLNHFHLLATYTNFHRDPLWTTQRTCIVSLFLFCAGLGQALAMHAAGSAFHAAVLAPLGAGGGLRRAGECGFGLHVPAQLDPLWRAARHCRDADLARLLAPLKGGLWLAGAVALLLPQFFRHALFNAPWLNWTGLGTLKPITEDWVPVLPWLGVVLWGLAAGQWLLAHRRSVLQGGVPPALRPLATLGRWSLSFYMLHQPVLIGSILAGRALGWW